jgi:nitrogen-specific signal transduction histidine kinase
MSEQLRTDLSPAFTPPERQELELLRQLLIIEHRARLQAEHRIETILAWSCHELRRPLQTIVTWLQVARSRRTDETLARRAFEVIEGGARLLAVIIADLQDYSRLAADQVRLTLQPVDLVEVLRALVDTTRLVAENKGLQLAADLPAETVWVLADGIRLEQIVSNLLANALKFTPAGGRVSVHVGRYGTDEVELSVRDTGRGIPPDALGRIFEPFWQADPGSDTESGIGLGLAIARALVHSHGGTLAAESAGEGQGATFRLRLPARAVTPAARRVPSAPGFPELRARRVLLVSTDAGVLGSGRVCLEGAGAVVTLARSLAEVRMMVDARFVDLLVWDGDDLPLLAAGETIQSVRQTGALAARRLSAVLLTSKPGDAVARARTLGFHACLAKPLALADLAAVLQRSGQGRLSPPV